ncbi:MAG: ParA family protein [Ktedonobacteraceae bacterium]
MSIYAIVQEKGGSGKSPTAMHLGYALSYLGEDTLIVDFDPQATASQHGQGFDYAQTEPTVYNSLVALKPIEPFKLQEHLYLLPAHSELEKAEIELPKPGAFYQVQLQKMLKLYSQFKHIVIDTPGSRISIFTTLALTAANVVIIPTKCEISHYHATIDTLSLIEDVREGLNPNLSVWGILPTQYEGTAHHREILEMLKQLRDPNGNLYPIYDEPSRKTTKYNDATSMRLDVRSLDETGKLGLYWDRVAASILAGKIVLDVV